MSKASYIVATIRPWNIKMFKEVIRYYPGRWVFVDKADDLTLDFVQKVKPRYIFFPHWSFIVPKEILDAAECVCFHETDLPYGRGGSPIQNLIQRGHIETMISAIRMTQKLDAGPVYMKRHLSLAGLAEEIFLRSSRIIAEMIGEIARKEPVPIQQKGRPVVFKRRKPSQSRIPAKIKDLEDLFDHIRMLDASGYPKAFLEYGGVRMEFSRPALRTDSIEADVRITSRKR